MSGGAELCLCVMPFLLCLPLRLPLLFKVRKSLPHFPSPGTSRCVYQVAQLLKSQTVNHVMCLYIKVLSADGQNQVGKVSKQWSGLVKEAFTDADNFGITCESPRQLLDQHLISCKTYKITWKICRARWEERKSSDQLQCMQTLFGLGSSRRLRDKVARLRDKIAIFLKDCVTRAIIGG